MPCYVSVKYFKIQFLVFFIRNFTKFLNLNLDDFEWKIIFSTSRCFCLLLRRSFTTVQYVFSLWPSPYFPNWFHPFFHRPVDRFKGAGLDALTPEIPQHGELRICTLVFFFVVIIMYNGDQAYIIYFILNLHALFKILSARLECVFERFLIIKRRNMASAPPP